jgi:hypothetical protein
MAFIIKRNQEIKPQKAKAVNKTSEPKKNNEKKNNKVMDNRIKMAEEIINDTPKAVKRIKKDKGLIERTESSKTILTEDNKQLLVD